MAIKNSVVRARIDGRIKAEAEAVLASIGLTVSDAFRMMMMRIATEKALPFEPLIPNAKTIEAMKAARRGEFVSCWLRLINYSRVECGRLDLPVALSATTSGKNQGGAARRLMLP